MGASPLIEVKSNSMLETLTQCPLGLSKIVKSHIEKYCLRHRRAVFRYAYLSGNAGCSLDMVPNDSQKKFYSLVIFCRKETKQMLPRFIASQFYRLLVTAVFALWHHGRLYPNTKNRCGQQSRAPCKGLSEASRCSQTDIGFAKARS